MSRQGSEKEDFVFISLSNCFKNKFPYFTKKKKKIYKFKKKRVIYFHFRIGKIKTRTLPSHFLSGKLKKFYNF